MSSSSQTTTQVEFVCACDESFRSACGGAFISRNEKQYCIIHYPGGDKTESFRTVLTDRLGGWVDDIGHRPDDGADAILNLRGAWFPEGLTFRGQRFKKALDFSGAVFNSGADFSSSVFEQSADFTGATFSGPVNFSRCEFEGEADFTGVVFEGGASVRFSNQTAFRKRASFNDGEFKSTASFSTSDFGGEADFSGAKFYGTASFSLARFSGLAKFSNSRFLLSKHSDDYAPVDFSSTVFDDEANFTNATFSGKVVFNKSAFRSTLKLVFARFEGVADFSDAAFGDYVRFVRGYEKPNFALTASLSLKDGNVETPGRVVFDTPYLRPHWFVNVDVREFSFVNVDWKWRKIKVRKEIKALKKKEIEERKKKGIPVKSRFRVEALDKNSRVSLHRALAVAYRHLAINAEDNHRYGDASRFRYMAMDTRRLESWHGFAPWKLSWWYWLASGYGERVSRAFLVLIFVILVPFALLYWKAECVALPLFEKRACVTWMSQAGGPAAPTESLPRALAYSLNVMTLQRPDPRPASATAQLLTGVETVLGPLQAALLALAIRRQFMH